jgi:hypothetical protein
MATKQYEHQLALIELDENENPPAGYLSFFALPGGAYTRRYGFDKKRLLTEDDISEKPSNGVFRGTCDTHTDPGVPVTEEWWSATEPGVYTNFGGVEVLTIYNVFNYIKWNNNTQVWSLQIVEIKSSTIQIPRIADDILDFYVTGDFEIGAKPYGAKKGNDPGYAYLYTGLANPTYHNRLNLDGDLYMSKLFAWDINMPAGTPLKWLSLDANKNIVFNDPPSGGGVTPADAIFDWDEASNSYKPYAAQRAGGGCFDTGTTAPVSTTRLNYDGTLYARQFINDGSVTGNVRVVKFTGGNLGFDYNYSGTYRTVTHGVMPNEYYIDAIVSSSSYLRSLPIKIGSLQVANDRYGEHVIVDDYNHRFDINMTKVRLNKGTALKWLVTDNNKEIAYVDNYETRAFHFVNMVAGDFLYLEPSAAFPYSIVSINVNGVDSSTNAYFYKNSTQYDIFNIGAGGQELSSVSVVPQSLAVGDSLRLLITNNMPNVAVRIKMVRTI